MSIWCDVFKLLYLSIHLYISLTEWHIDSCSNKAFDSKMFLFFVTFYETPCIGYIYVLYVSIDQDISGLMMNILIMQTIRPIIAFYFIFLFMLIRHSSNITKMSTSRAFLFSYDKYLQWYLTKLILIHRLIDKSKSTYWYETQL